MMQALTKEWAVSGIASSKANVEGWGGGQQMEGKLYCKWNGIRANDIRANGKNGVPLMTPSTVCDLFSVVETSRFLSNDLSQDAVLLIQQPLEIYT